MTSDLLEENQDLRKEITELRNNGFTVSAMTEQQLKIALEKGEQLEKENAELKKQVEQKQHLADVRLEQSLENYNLFANERKERIDIDIALEDMKDKLAKAKEIIKAYYKANEWHYVKDGLPKDNEYVLIYTDLNNCYVAKKVENHFMSKGWGFIPMSTVIAWKEIVLPELKESE